MTQEEQIKRLAKARKFLGQLLDDTGEWGCTDKQWDLRHELELILGKENMPDWLVKNDSV